MGVKIVGASVCLNIVAVLFEVIAASMTWHSTRVIVLGATVFRMKAGLLTASIDQGASLLCKGPPADYCKSLEDGQSLREAAQQWCASAIVHFTDGPCHAFSTAFYMGLAVTLTLVVNIIVVSVSCWLLYRYATAEKHKAIYRHTATVMQIVATLALLSVTIMYFMLAGAAMDNIVVSFVPTGSGTGYGQIMFIVAVLMQAAAAAMTQCVAMGNEQTEDYILGQMQKEQMYHYGGAKGFSTQGGDAERGYNQAFTNGPTQQPNFVQVQQDWVQPGFAPAPAPSRQQLAPQMAYMAQPAVAVSGPPVMGAAVSYTGTAAW